MKTVRNILNLDCKDSPVMRRGFSLNGERTREFFGEGE